MATVMDTSLARDLMSDDEWAFFEPFISAVRAANGLKSPNHRLALDGIFWIARTGAPWRDLPEEWGQGGRVSTGSSGAGRWPGSGRTSWTR